MNLETLTESTNKVRVEIDLPDLDKEVAVVVNDPEYVFYLIGLWEENQLFDISNDQIYRVIDGKIEKIEKMEYTGEVYFGDIYYLTGDKDAGVIYKAVFVDGSLTSIKLYLSEYQDNTLRKKTISVLLKRINRSQRLSNSPLFKYIYRPYQLFVHAVFFAVRHCFLFVFKVVDYLLDTAQKLLAPY